jgi:5'(3')-deoxyribonucleotidase
LFDENNAIRLYMNDTYGFKHTEADYLVTGPFENYWERIWQLDPEQAQKRYEAFVVSSYKENLEPMKDALDTLKNLRKRYDLVIVTSRDHRTVEWTHNALSKHYPNIFDDVHFVPLWGNGEKVTKAKICVEIGASYLLDDNYEHCKLAAETGIEAILFGDYGWNRNQALVKGMVRCKNWQAVGDLLLR